VTLALIAINVVAYGVEYAQGARLDAFVQANALVATRFWDAASGSGSLPHEVYTLYASMFLHGDLWHLLGNMWFLWIFGDNVEDRLGRFGFLVFYLLAGMVAGLSQIVLTAGSEIPMLGASGAVAGVLGAYLRFFPGARVYTLVPIFVVLQFLELPALVFLGFWFLVQIVSSLLGVGGIAWYAHIFGFLGGFAMSLVVARKGGGTRRPRPRNRVMRLPGR